MLPKFFARQRALLRAAVLCSVPVPLAATLAGGPAGGCEPVNAAIGAPVFSDENLWDDDAVAVARRLGWPEESATSTDSSYREYPGESDSFLGARPRSKALYGEGGLVSSISVVFANKGDGVMYAKLADSAADRRERKGQILDYKRAIQEERKILRSELTKLFGEPEADRFGQSRSGGEPVMRWNWRDHAFLLASPRDEYVSLRIVPAAVADSGGRSRVPDSEMRARLASRVERRSNGDVVLADMPMVSQGPKGYCVPATWERAMRYMGVPADMYVLAMEGNTGEGGGSSMERISWGAKAAIIGAGRRFGVPAVKLKASDVAAFIDRGLPLMWCMFSTDDYNRAADSRAEARKAMTDPDAWAETLKDARKDARKFRADKDAGHACLIIGYNKTTGELCVSDSWGPAFRERWIAEEEAKAVSQNVFYAIEL